MQNHTIAFSSRRIQPYIQVDLSISILLFSAFFLQKFAVPGTAGSIPISLPILGTTLFFGVLSGGLTLHIDRIIVYITVTALFIISAAFSSSFSISIPGLILMLVYMVPYIFSKRVASSGYALGLFVYFSLITALLCIIQQVLQRIGLGDLAFVVDIMTPDTVRQVGYNSLEAGGPVGFKSTGFFMAEPSLASQFIAVAIIIEFCSARRTLVVSILSIGQLTTFSGTGLLMIIASLPFLFGDKYNFKGVIFFVILTTSIVVIVYLSGINLYTSRLEEFGDERSSAFARFISIFYLLKEYVWTDTYQVIFGRGPGNVTEYKSIVMYETHDPTWGKLAYEYGIFGLLAYICFLWVSLRRSRSPTGLKTILLIQFFFMGGYLSTPHAHLEVISLLAWQSKDRINKRYPRSVNTHALATREDR